MLLRKREISRSTIAIQKFVNMLFLL